MPCPPSPFPLTPNFSPTQEGVRQRPVSRQAVRKTGRRSTPIVRNPRSKKSKRSRRLAWSPEILSAEPMFDGVIDQFEIKQWNHPIKGEKDMLYPRTYQHRLNKT